MDAINMCMIKEYSCTSKSLCIHSILHMHTETLVDFAPLSDPPPQGKIVPVTIKLFIEQCIPLLYISG